MNRPRATVRSIVMINHWLFKSMLALGAVSLVSTGAIAHTKWQRHHPRRAEVNHRIAHQNHRITEERREGDITSAQAKALRATDRSIRAQERADAATHHGHITKKEQRTLNAELNANSKAIGH